MQLAGSISLNLANYSHQSIQIYSEDLYKNKYLHIESSILLYHNLNSNPNPKKSILFSKRGGIEIGNIEN